jgi:cytochrome P450
MYIRLIRAKFAIYGKNVAATVGDEWKRHRKITARTFTQKSLHLVHAETTRQVSQMMTCWARNVKNGSVIVERYFPSA